MPASSQIRTAAFYALYRIGVAMARASIALMLVAETELIYRFEQICLPRLPVFGGVTVPSTLVADLYLPADLHRPRGIPRNDLPIVQTNRRINE